MILILLIGVAFIGVAFALFARALLAPRLKAADALRQIDVYGFDATEPEARKDSDSRLPALRAPHVRGLLDSLANGVGGFLSTRIERLNQRDLRGHLQGAGFYTLSPERFTGYQALASLTLGLVLNRFAQQSGKSTVMVLLLTAIGFVAGWKLPLVWAKRRERHRGERIEYELPDLVDTLVATVEAGIAFSASLQIASKRSRGPLGEELRLTMQEHSMGLGLRDALNNLAARQNTPAVRTFVRSLVQGEELGISVGQTLRNLSHDMRMRRRQLAEERAHEAPVKIVLPLVIFIFPALLTIILGPAFLGIHNVFK